MALKTLRFVQVSPEHLCSFLQYSKTIFPKMFCLNIISEIRDLKVRKIRFTNKCPERCKERTPMY